MAEQVITDDDPVDEVAELLAVCSRLAEAEKLTLLGARLRCCVADLEVREGSDPRDAFRILLRLARTGAFLNDGVQALILRRTAYAHALVGYRDDAIGLYEESVRSASDARLGGDARNALRGVVFLAEDMFRRFELGRAASSVGNSARLFPAGDSAGLSTLEHLVDDHDHMARANALFEARTSLRIERVSGGLMEVAIAQRRHGQVLVRAGEFDAAVVPLVRAGHRDLARRAAEQAERWHDVGRFLRGGPPWSLPAACAVTAARADLIPDDAMMETAAALVQVLHTTPLNTAKEALPGLAALGQRLPARVAQLFLDWARGFLDRGPDSPGMGDQEAFAVLAALGRHPDDGARDAATELLVEAMRLGLYQAVDYLAALPPTRTAQLGDLASAGNDHAVAVLARWHQVTPTVVQAAVQGVQRILSHRLGPRTEYTPDSSAPQDACALAAVLADNVADKPRLAELTDQLAAVVEHLIAWAEDGHDIAGSRSSALRALRILREHVDPAQHGELHQRLFALADDPNLAPGDLFDQASTHPFSRMKFNAGSEHLAADALLAAASFAHTETDAAAITQRLIPALAAGNTDDWDVDLRARTLSELERLQHTDLVSAFRHPAARVRATATRLWAQRPDRTPATALRLAGDPGWQVRRVLAAVLSALPETERAAYSGALASLSTDPSYFVRSAVNQK